METTPTAAPTFALSPVPSYLLTAQERGDAHFYVDAAEGADPLDAFVDAFDALKTREPCAGLLSAPHTATGLRAWHRGRTVFHVRVQP